MGDSFIPDSKDSFVPDSFVPDKRGLDYLLSAAGMRNAIDPTQLLHLAAAPAQAAGDPRNVQATIAAAKMQPAAPGTPMAGQAVNMGYRYGAPLMAAAALPASLASVPVAAGIRGAMGGGMLARGLGTIAGAGAGALEQGAVGGGVTMAQNMIAGNSPGQAANAGLQTGEAFAKGQLTADALFGIPSGAAKIIAKNAPVAVRQWFGIPEPITEAVIAKGPGSVLTKENANPDKQLDLIESMQNALRGQKQEAGQAIGRAEDILVGSQEGKKLFDASPVAATIRKELERPIFNPVVNQYGGAAAEKATLEKLAGHLESGLISGEDLVGLRKNLDKMITYRGGPLPPPSKDLERVIGNVNTNLRGTLHNAYPETLGSAYDEFSQAASIYNRFRKPLGGSVAPDGDIFTDINAARRLRLALEKGGASQDALLDFDNHVAKGQGLMDQFYNTVLAQEFAAKSPRQLSPSSPVLRILATLGLTAPQTAGIALKAGEQASRMGGRLGQLRQPVTSTLQGALGSNNEP